MTRSIRLARVVTTSFTFSTLLQDQIAVIRDAGIEITLVSCDDGHLSQVAEALDVAYHAIPMARRPDLDRDVRSVLLLARFLHTHPFDIVHSSTPKAGLLTALAGAMGGTPIRLHTYTGQRWATLQGFQRRSLRGFDRLVGLLSSMTYADSSSQREFLIREHIVRPSRIKVLGSGSLSGVNLERFDPRRISDQMRLDTRAALGIPKDALVIVFVGRLTRDKGIAELVEAFTYLSDRHTDLFLILVGPFEPDLDPIPTEIQSILESNHRICSTGFCSDPEKYLGAADIFCLPSYREGFGSVIIEAGAMGLPSVATSVTGLMDAVEDGKTGLLVPSHNSRLLAAALEALITQPELRRTMGTAARERAVRDFDAKIVNELVVTEYIAFVRHHPHLEIGL